MLTASTIVLDGATLTPQGVDAVARRGAPVAHGQSAVAERMRKLLAGAPLHPHGPDRLCAH
jgi:hypothetical protein